MRTLLIFALLLSACSIFESDEPEKRLEGERLPVVLHSDKLKVDPDKRHLITLPDARASKTWMAPAEQPVEHIGISTTLQDDDNVSIGSEPEEGYRFTSPPIIAEGKIFTIDGEGTLAARSVSDPDDTLWTFALETREAASSFMGFSMGTERKPFIGGNAAYVNGAIYVTTGRGEIYAISAKNGALKWVRSVTIPIRSRPVSNGKLVYAITTENRLYALDAQTGRSVWTHEGIAETTSIYGAPAPAVSGDVIVVPYSSGQIAALDAGSGRVLWNDILIASRGARTTADFHDIDAAPRIKGRTVYVAGHDNQMKALDITSGDTVWQKDVGTVNDPWVAGDFIYVITTNNQVACLYRHDGAIQWVKPLPAYTEAGSFSYSGKGERIQWSGPVIAADTVLVAGSHGRLLMLSPRTGEVQKQIDIPVNTYLPPIVAGNRIYIQSNDADLRIIY